MKVMRCIFAPFFWLRDILDESLRIRRILLAQLIVGLKFSPMSHNTKLSLLAAMLLKGPIRKELVRDRMDDAASLLRSVEMDD